MRHTTPSKPLLQRLSPQQLHLLMGEVVGLMLLSPVHRTYQLRDVADAILPLLNLNQYRMVRDAKGRPIGLLTWGWLSEGVAREYVAGRMVFSEAELKGGEQLWFMDFIAPYGHGREIMRHVRRELFPNAVARAMRVEHTQEGPKRRILRLRGSRSSPRPLGGEG